MHRVAIYGIEGHEDYVLESIGRRDDAVCVGIASEDEARFESVKDFEAVTDGTHLYSDWKKMLDEEEVDVLVICSQSDRHVDVILEAAHRGIHVMSEKPVATDREGLTAVRNTVAKSGIHFSALLTMRTMPAYAGMREAVRSGVVGTPVMIFAQKSYKMGTRPDWMKVRSSFGGTIPYVGCHMLDLAMWITGLDVVRVSAVHGNAARPEVGEMEDHAAVIFEMTDGAAMALTLDYLRPETAATWGDDRLRIAGSKGVIEVRSAENARTLLTGDGPLTEFATAEVDDLFADFLDAVDGKKEHVIKPEEVWRMTEILLGALEAADTGLPRAV